MYSRQPFVQYLALFDENSYSVLACRPHNQSPEMCHGQLGCGSTNKIEWFERTFSLRNIKDYNYNILMQYIDVTRVEGVGFAFQHTSCTQYQLRFCFELINCSKVENTLMLIALRSIALM